MLRATTSYTCASTSSTWPRQGATTSAAAIERTSARPSRDSPVRELLTARDTTPGGLDSIGWNLALTEVAAAHGRAGGPSVGELAHAASRGSGLIHAEQRFGYRDP